MTDDWIMGHKPDAAISRDTEEPRQTTADDELFRPVSEMTATEWDAARAEVQRRWPKQSRFPS
ncbi:hypothetical protein [Amycolatopsis sp. Hca4]|uniref:hypothetical protein n=1 Tax=Amycolatopsis sp. Hca4 TaxID=2742131 RepID=UPI0015910635|nr:hypothetical protein [Amycolatopsis sp. Hca4]QKV74520.1 hypothetical protein HUT10_12640 [Amycolatopsis sp. Hca4]